MSNNNKFNLVFQVEDQTVSYPYTGSLRGAKLAAAGVFKREYYGHPNPGHIHVKIQFEKHQVASKTFWHDARWSTLAPRLLTDLGL